MVRSSSYEGQHPMVVQRKQLTDQKDWIDAVCESWSCSTWWKVASFLSWDCGHHCFCCVCCNRQKNIET
eukprot:UN19059